MITAIDDSEGFRKKFDAKDLRIADYQVSNHC
jgi:hypothetical protein